MICSSTLLIRFANRANRYFLKKEIQDILEYFCGISGPGYLLLTSGNHLESFCKVQTDFRFR